MPYKPKSPCAFPGCPRLTGGRFCDEHAKQDAREYERYRRDPDTRRHYGKAWKRIRDRYIAAHPLCEQCKRSGRLTPAQEVHHILPLSQGGTHDPTNLMSLCTACHSGITLAENNRCRGGLKSPGTCNRCNGVGSRAQKPQFKRGIKQVPEKGG
jgi:5-methylcytosine-specific restriction protein A